MAEPTNSQHTIAVVRAVRNTDSLQLLQRERVAWQQGAQRRPRVSAAAAMNIQFIRGKPK